LGLVGVVLLLVSGAFSLGINPFLPDAPIGNDQPGICGTMEVYEQRYNLTGDLAPAATCQTQGACDVPETRANGPAES